MSAITVKELDELITTNRIVTPAAMSRFVVMGYDDMVRCKEAIESLETDRENLRTAMNGNGFGAVVMAEQRNQFEREVTDLRAEVARLTALVDQQADKLPQTLGTAGSGHVVEMLTWNASQCAGCGEAIGKRAWMAYHIECDPPEPHEWPEHDIAEQRAIKAEAERDTLTAQLATAKAEIQYLVEKEAGEDI